MKQFDTGRVVRGCALLVLLQLLLAATAFAQLGGLGSKKVNLRRALPPAVALEAKSFSITASSQEAAGQQIASSFEELFKAKIQNDERFVYNDTSPELRMSIVVTRFYVEPKTLTKGKTTCQTNLGNLQGSFRVIESDSGRPVASDAIAWRLTTNELSHVLVSDDGIGLELKGPGMQLSDADMRDGVANLSWKRKITANPFARNHPCEVPFTPNEARDALADIFLTEIVHLATPYTVNLEVKVSKNNVFRNAVEEMAANNWSKSLDELLLADEQPKPADEAARLHLIGLAYEGLGYKQGELSFEQSERIRRGMSEDELTPIRTELVRTEDSAKDYFDKASRSFKKAAELKDEEEYRSGERRADESRRLYARIQKYRSLDPEPEVSDKPRPLTMPEIVSMCLQGSSGSIIAYRIQSADEVKVSAAQLGELTKCGDKQDAIFEVLKDHIK